MSRLLPRPVAAVVFDMDGLLVDTESVYFRAMEAAAIELGGTLSLQDFRRFVGLPADVSDQQALYVFGRDFPIDQWRDRTEVLAHEIVAAGLTLKAGVVELLDHLDVLGLPRAIATSSSHATVERHLGWSGIVSRFGAVVAHGDYARGKPHPDPYLTAAERLGVAPEWCLALEDSHNGVRAASSAGMMTVMVPDMLEATDEMRGLCVRIADDLHAVLLLLGEARESA